MAFESARASKSISSAKCSWQCASTASNDAVGVRATLAVFMRDRNPIVYDAADDLLAEELRPEGADPEDMSDGVGIPSLGQHRDGDDATNLFPELAWLADGVHHFAEEVFVGELVDVGAGVAAPVLVLEQPLE